MRAADQLADADEYARRVMAMEVPAVDAVESVVQGKIGAVHRHRHQVIHREAGALEGELETVHQQARLRIGARGGIAGGRVDADVTADVQRVAEAHRVAERKRRPVGGGRMLEVAPLGSGRSAACEWRAEHRCTECQGTEQEPGCFRSECAMHAPLLPAPFFYGRFAAISTARATPTAMTM